MPMLVCNYFSITGVSSLARLPFSFQCQTQAWANLFQRCGSPQVEFVTENSSFISNRSKNHKWNTSLFHISDIYERKWIHLKKGCTVSVLPIPCWVNTNNVGLGKFIDRGLVIYFVCELGCRQLYFTVSVSFEGGLSRLLRKQMSILRRLISLIRLAASSIPTFIYLLMYLLTYSFTHLCLDLVWFPSPTPPMYTPHLSLRSLFFFLFLLSSLASISKISLQRREDNIH